MASAPATAGESFVSYSGTAADPSSRFLYRENHVLHYHDGQIAERVVLYTCRDGSPFARKTVSYVDSLSPDFLLEDASNGMREGIRTEGTIRKVFFRNDRVAAEKSSAVPAVSGLVADSGFDAFVRSNWQPLMQGHGLGMKFLIPSRLEDMEFKVRHVRTAEVDGISAEVFRLKLSGVFGLIAPSIDVYYGASDHVLLRYVGVSDLRNASHDNLKADIGFRPNDRRLGDAQAMAMARAARLAPCK